MRYISAVLAVTAAASISAFAQTSPTPKIERQVETRIISPEAAGVSYIGVELRDVNKDNFSQYGLAEVRGVAVDRVAENSPAAKAGLQKGDVIVSFNGEGVTSARKLQRLVSEVAPDHQAKVTVLRAGKEVEISVTVGKREAAIADGNFMLEGMPGMLAPNVPIVPNGQGEFNLRIPRIGEMPRLDGENIERLVIVREGGRQIGVGIVPLTKQLGDYFGASEGRGLLINEVRENSPAAKAGLKAGDVIVAADGKSVGEAPELIEAINAKKEGEVTLSVIRNKKKETVKVTPETRKDDGNERKIERVIINGAPIGD